MLLFQVTYAKRGPDQAEPMGAQVSIAKASEQFFKKDIQDFISTLTPGAQNAIKACSFAWGYENAAKYVKNAMVLDEVKNAGDMIDRSRATIQSIENQASASHEKATDVTSFAWGFYNEDLKAFQAQAGKSETITERDKAKKEAEPVPLSPQEALVASVEQLSVHPALLYCASSLHVAQEAQQRQEEEHKRHELTDLIVQKEQKEQAKIIKNEELARLVRENRTMENAVNIALERRDELLHEYEKLEKQLQAALDKLEGFAKDEKDMVKKIADMLPRELAQFLLSHEKSFRKRAVLRKQLAKWLAFSHNSRKSLLSVSMDRLVKMFSISSLLK